MRLSNSLRNFALLIALGCCWGPSFLFIKLAVEEVSPLTVVAMRLLIGASLLLTFVTLRGDKPWRYIHEWPRFACVGLFACALPFSLITWGEQSVPSSLAAIINSMTPIFTAIGAHFFVKGERLNVQKISGILFGFCGILLIFLPALFHKTLGHATGMSAILMAAVCYAIGIVYSRLRVAHVPSLISAAGQIVAAALLVTPMALLLERPWNMAIPSASAIFGILGMAILGTAIAFTVFFALVKSAGATYMSTAALLFPAIAVLLGIIVLDETLTWNIVAGCTMIFSGLAIANRLVNFVAIRKFFTLIHSSQS